ncbi:MAG: flavodoxin, partial [Kiritimatiellae bacterium]|nr:flavodoxin [Kiritimatiellia bacterium]
MNVSSDIRHIGVNDHAIDLFEGQYAVPNGMAYNSYAILDEKTAVMDTVDVRFRHEWLDNIARALAGRKPDYLVVQHMEPDHSANIAAFMEAFPAATLVSSAKAFAMMENFFGTAWEDRRLVVKEGDTLA